MPYKVNCCLLFILFAPFTLLAQIVKTNIVVSNIQAGKGSVVLSIYDKKENFFKTALMTRTQKAEKPILIFTFSVPPGTYAIAIFQDLDDDGKLKLGWFNIPKEPVGLGNNFKPGWSKPTFENCAVSIVGKDTTFSIKLN